MVMVVKVSGDTIIQLRSFFLKIIQEALAQW